ncbi:MAG: hypothetical protein ACOZDD_09350 [Bacteroidota bacterium]
MKIVNSSPITPFGGINFAIKEAIDLNINNLINSNMVDLAKQSKYTWFDIIMSYWSAFFCRGDCAEHQFSLADSLNRLNLKMLSMLPGFKKENVILDYDNTIIEALGKNANHIFVRARMTDTLERDISGIKEWEEVKISDNVVLRGSTTFVPFVLYASGNNEKTND